MSNLAAFKNVEQVIKFVQPQFEELAKIHGIVNFKAESSFALQYLAENDFLARVAMGNQDSLKRAIINVAAIGLSLNPIEKLAYLIPRKGKVCLDISYRGLLHVAYAVGAIKWAMAELVYANDVFEHKGVGREPVHSFSPFTDRGELLGGYVLAKTQGDEFIITHMSIKEIFDIRDRSESWKAFKEKKVSSPWKTDEGEMIKKTLIRRASKSWPHTDMRVRFERAVEAMEEVDPMEFALPPGQEEIERKELLLNIRGALADLGRAEETYVKYLTRINKRKIEKLEDMTNMEMESAIIMLTQLVNEKKG